MRLHERTRAITLEVILRAVFGVEAERMATLRAAIARLLEPAQLAAADAVRAAPPEPRAARPARSGAALDRLDALIYEEIARRRAQTDLAERTDILSLLMLARDEDGQAMTDGELRDELVTLLLAGHETTATAVAWAIERLVRHPDKLARLMAEIDACRRRSAEDEYLRRSSTRRCACGPVVPLVARLLREPLPSADVSSCFRPARG